MPGTGPARGFGSTVSPRARYRESVKPGPPERPRHGRRYRAPSSHRDVWSVLGVAVTTIATAAILALIGVKSESFGFAIMLGMPFATGIVVGRHVRIRRAAILLACWIAMLALVPFVFGYFLDSGAFCLFTLISIMATPLMVGILAGALLFNRAPPSRTAACVVLVAIAIPIEQAAFVPVSESVQTSRVVSASADVAFRRITFYEDLEGPPPTLLRIALPRPIRTEGPPPAVGVEKRCVYEGGYILKRITTLQPGVLYEFRVTEQVNVEDRAVTLLGGSIRLAPAGPGRTRVTLTTRYRPKLAARLLWRPYEYAVVHTLHDHVLDHIANTRQPRDR